VSHELEWQEALYFMRDQSIKKIYLCKGKGIFFKDSAPPQPQYFYEKTGEGEKKVVKEVSPALQSLGLAVPSCLERLFEGGKILPNHLPDYLQDAVKVRNLPNSEVDLDVDVSRLHPALMRHALALFDQKRYEEAKKILEALKQLNDKDPLTLYNLACAEALLGEKERALTHLSASVENGYANLAHMKADSDLESLRVLPGYVALVNKMEDEEKKNMMKAPFALNSINNNNNNNNINSSSSSSSTVEKKEEEKIPEISNEVVVVVEEEEKKQEEENAVKKEEEEKTAKQFENELRLLEDMGFMDRQQNLALLASEKGDLASVIAMLFA